MFHRGRADEAPRTVHRESNRVLRRVDLLEAGHPASRITRASMVHYGLDLVGVTYTVVTRTSRACSWFSEALTTPGAWASSWTAASSIITPSAPDDSAAHGYPLALTAMTVRGLAALRYCSRPEHLGYIGIGSPALDLAFLGVLALRGRRRGSALTVMLRVQKARSS